MENLNDMVIFAKVVEANGFSEAARRMGVSKSSVSKSIARLEKALGVQLFREDRTTESEFVTISYWESVEAMSRFTGGDPHRIHHLARDPEYLIELPDGVQVLDIVASSGRFGAGKP